MNALHLGGWHLAHYALLILTVLAILIAVAVTRGRR